MIGKNRNKWLVATRKVLTVHLLGTLTFGGTFFVFALVTNGFKNPEETWFYWLLIILYGAAWLVSLVCLVVGFYSGATKSGLALIRALRKS